MFAYSYLFLYAFAYVYVWLNVFLRVCVNLFVCADVCAFACIYMFMWVCACLNKQHVPCSLFLHFDYFTLSQQVLYGRLNTTHL